MFPDPESVVGDDGINEQINDDKSDGAFEDECWARVGTDGSQSESHEENGEISEWEQQWNKIEEFRA